MCDAHVWGDSTGFQSNWTEISVILVAAHSMLQCQAKSGTESIGDVQQYISWGPCSSLLFCTTSTVICSSTFLEGRSAHSCPSCFVLIQIVQMPNPRKSSTTWTAAYFPINSRNYRTRCQGKSSTGPDRPAAATAAVLEFFAKMYSNYSIITGIPGIRNDREFQCYVLFIIPQSTSKPVDCTGFERKRTKWND